MRSTSTQGTGTNKTDHYASWGNIAHELAKRRVKTHGHSPQLVAKNPPYGNVFKIKK